MNVTVLTASIPQRASMLAEAIQSVCEQSQPPFAHLVAVDVCRLGAPMMLNRLLDAVATEWLMVLDDDDLLDPHHLKTLVGNSVDADVVYSYCRTEGRPFEQYNQPFDALMLEHRSVVSHTALVRTSCVREVGGWHRERGYDWDLWKRIRGEGATFRSVPEVTWTYRLLGGNESWDGVADAPSVLAS